MISRTIRCVVAAAVLAFMTCASRASAQSGGLTCETAIEFSAEGGSVPFNRTGATVDLDLTDLCDHGPSGNDIVWNVVFYRWTPRYGGMYELSTCNSADHDTKLAVLTSCDVATVVACNDDGEGCFSYTSRLTFDAQCGTEYILAVGGYSSSTPLGTGTLVLTPITQVCDCDANRVSDTSPDLTPFSFSQPREWIVSGVQPGDTGATLTVTARGQLGTSTRFLTVKVDGAVVATSVFGAGSGAGLCTSMPSVAAITLSPAQFTALAADGELAIRIEPSINATSAGCDTATLAVNLLYEAPIIDCDGDGVPDECVLEDNDCNQNQVLDSCDIASGTSIDVDANGRPDECEVDCNGNDLPDPWEISQGLVPDCNQNGIPDSCDIARGGTSTDVDANGVPDDCKADCNNNALPDAYEIAQGLVADCDNNAVPDSCQIAGAPSLDCNSDGILDSCQGGPNGSDCDGNGIPDICDIVNGAEDKNGNGRLDICELRYGDLNLDGQVNGTDLAGLLAVWGLPNPPYGDLDGDGQVGGADLAFLLARWGPVP